MYKNKSEELLPAWYIGMDKRYGNKAHNMYVLEKRGEIRIYMFERCKISERTLSNLEDLVIEDIPSWIEDVLRITFNESQNLKRIMKSVKK